MPKATIELENGTKVTIEGSTNEVKELLEFYGKPIRRSDSHEPNKQAFTQNKKVHKAAVERLKVDLTAIIASIKNSPDADAIAERILDRSSAIDRILLPLFIVHEHMDNSIGLTSGEVSEITRNLGTPISMANVAHAFSGSASRYVVGDKVRKKGVAVRYKLSRKGLGYIKSIVAAKNDADKK